MFLQPPGLKADGPPSQSLPSDFTAQNKKLESKDKPEEMDQYLENIIDQEDQVIRNLREKEQVAIKDEQDDLDADLDAIDMQNFVNNHH